MPTWKSVEGSGIYQFIETQLHTADSGSVSFLNIPDKYCLWIINSCMFGSAHLCYGICHCSIV